MSSSSSSFSTWGLLTHHADQSLLASAATSSIFLADSRLYSASGITRYSGLSGMDWLHNLIWHNGKFLGIDWTLWKIVGWCGNAVFFSRFFIQWYATEKLKQVVVPVAFWWLSLLGSLLLLTYAVFHNEDSVFIFAYAFTWIPYIRNLIIHHRHADAHLDCPKCGKESPPHSNFCSACGTKLAEVEEKAGASRGAASAD